MGQINQVPDDIVQLIPATGFVADYFDSDDGKLMCTERLVGWGLQRDGDVVALSAESNGSVMPMTYLGGYWIIRAEVPEDMKVFSKDRQQGIVGAPAEIVRREELRKQHDEIVARRAASTGS